MKFLNKRTGAVIDVPCRLEGPDWEEMKEAKVKAPASEPEAAPAKKTAVKRRAKASD